MPHHLRPEWTLLRGLCDVGDDAHAVDHQGSGRAPCCPEDLQGRCPEAW